MPEEVAAIDTAGALGPDSYPGEELENRRWRRAIWLRGNSKILYWLILVMVLGLWAGEHLLGWAFRQH